MFMTRPRLQYWCAAAAELAAWRKWKLHRSRSTVEKEYRHWTVSLTAPVMAIAPDGTIFHSTVGAVRQENWKAIIDALRDDIRVERDDRVLEVGAGDGTNVRELAARGPEFRWHGLDLVPRHRCILPGDATALPFRDRAFGAVVTYNALEQMSGAVVATVERVRARCEARRCLRRTGLRAGWDSSAIADDSKGLYS